MADAYSHVWFIYSDEIVTGPFSTDQVRDKIGKGEVPANSFVWWKGQREWLPVAQWEQSLKGLLNPAETQHKPVWYIDNGGSPMGPLTQGEVIQNLRGLPELGRVRLWAVGMESWTSLFEFHDIMEILGISRRENDRAPLMSAVAVNRSSDDPKGYLLRAASVSIAGMGLTGDHDLRRGDEVAILIKNSEIGTNVHVRGEVAYVTERGYVGVRFHRVHPETLARINEYVTKFNPRAAAA